MKQKELIQIVKPTKLLSDKNYIEALEFQASPEIFGDKLDKKFVKRSRVMIWENGSNEIEVIQNQIVYGPYFDGDNEEYKIKVQIPTQNQNHYRQNYYSRYQMTLYIGVTSED